ncbi:MAG: tetratricopeptide repeat protein [Clostridiales bacterium]|nr:tetratricopeptide repeat protein [Clostridiales bacterium]
MKFIRKRMPLFLFAVVCSAFLLLSGCGDSDKMQEYKELGISQMEAGDYESAVQSFQKALDQSVGTIGAEELDICYYRALALYQSGDTEGAIEVYTALAEYDSENWEIYYLRGSIYLQEGQSEAALEDYAKAFSLNDDDVELCVHIYENLSDAGLSESGQEYLNQVLSVTPSTAEEYYFVGDMYFLTGDYENALADLKQAEELGYDKALLLLGCIYAEEGDSESAETAFTSYMEKYPEDAEALSGLGEIALEAGEYEDAIFYLESALEVGDSSIERAILKNLIIAYEYSGDFESACDMAAEFLMKYEDEEISREYEFLQTRVGDDIESSSDEESEEDESESAEEGEEDVSGSVEENVADESESAAESGTE